jgi:hypothetical protein
MKKPVRDWLSQGGAKSMSNKFVIGGGWSVGQYADRLDVLTSYGHVIGVNEASVLTDVHEALTMDRLWFEHRWEQLAKSRVQKVWVREKCDCNVEGNGQFAWTRFKHFNRPYPSIEHLTLHGGNSGTCAVNLALQQMDSNDNLFLLGFDMQKGPEGQPYWHKPYSWTSPEGATKPGHFRDWVRDMHGFSQYAKVKKLNVYNITTRSMIPHFPKMTFPQMMEMLNGL